MYGGVDEHPDVPAKQGYGDRIVTALGPSRAAVDFFGRVDAGKAAILGRWTVALLNPTGRTEADPSSLKEALAAGAIPVASGDFGMWDLMHRFPRQTISDPRRMARTVIDALADDALSERFRRARTTVLEELLERDAALDDEWVRLLGTSSRQMTGFVPHSQFVPQPPTGIVRRRLIRRRMLSSARTQASAARRILSPIRT
jgi:glycosyltransferase involved in cell wall biosynthesis